MPWGQILSSGMQECAAHFIAWIFGVCETAFLLPIPRVLISSIKQKLQEGFLTH